MDRMMFSAYVLGSSNMSFDYCYLDWKSLRKYGRRIGWKEEIEEVKEIKTQKRSCLFCFLTNTQLQLLFGKDHELIL